MSIFDMEGNEEMKHSNKFQMLSVLKEMKHSNNNHNCSERVNERKPREKEKFENLEKKKGLTEEERT